MGRNLARRAGPRVTLYSHDTQGLGHMRRNLALAEALAGGHECTVLLISGAREAGVFPMPDGVDCLALPAIDKSLDGRYRPRSLAVSLQQLLRVRAETIKAAVESFEPDVLVADKVPLGLGSELQPALELLHDRGGCRMALGMRDVLDHPEAVRREWRDDGSADALRRYYDAIWVYGDARVYDPVIEYGLPPDLAAMVSFTGYIDRRAAESSVPAGDDDIELPNAPFSLCLVGGGQDGYALADCFVTAALERDAHALVVTGPFMPPAQRRRLTRRIEHTQRLRVVEFAHGLDTLIDCAQRVVAMGGYNTVCELVARSQRALIVPRVRPREEQLIRAQRMHDLGLLDLLHPDALSAAALADWLERGPAPRPRVQLDLGGLTRVPQLVGELLSPPSRKPAHAA